jgi:hypothetical protein
MPTGLLFCFWNKTEVRLDSLEFGGSICAFLDVCHSTVVQMHLVLVPADGACQRAQYSVFYRFS